MAARTNLGVYISVICAALSLGGRQEVDGSDAGVRHKRVPAAPIRFAAWLILLPQAAPVYLTNQEMVSRAGVEPVIAIDNT